VIPGSNTLLISSAGAAGRAYRRARSAVDAVDDATHAAIALIGAGYARPVRPDRAARAGLALTRWKMTPAAAAIANAALYPRAEAIIDELGVVTFAELEDRTNRLANAWADAGLISGDGIAIMCRNHRGFIEAAIACSKLGAHALLMNTSFAGPQLAEVARREQPAALVYDEEFAELVADAGRRRKRFVAWVEDGQAADPSLEQLISDGDPTPPLPPASPGRVVILTSGTTGTPKGASRSQPQTIGPLIAILSRIPLRARKRTLIAAPLFHAWGFAHLQLGFALSSTLVLRRRFEPADTLATIAQHRVPACPMVPVMLQRILELEPEQRERYDVSALRVVPVSGSALPGDLAARFMDAFGDVVYNLYGSTEVAWATIATPRDLRAAPGTAGRAPRGTVLKILGEDDREVPMGESGRIFVGNEMLFEGYTGGGSKDSVGGLMATGDVGHLDHARRLFIDGRGDDMIVSGGENVYPEEVEDVIAKLSGVKEAAAVGVSDDEFGQRLVAYVVKGPGGTVTADDVKGHVKKSLARYKVPRDVKFVDELPRNSTGKVLKRELAERGEKNGRNGS
jgi:acyl-CoA synthetase (AMP-forming)/AMP-acid ligase II